MLSWGGHRMDRMGALPPIAHIARTSPLRQGGLVVPMARGAPAGRNRSSLVAAEPLEHALQDFEIASVVDDEAPSLGVDSRGAPQRLRESRLESSG